MKWSDSMWLANHHSRSQRREQESQVVYRGLDPDQRNRSHIHFQPLPIERRVDQTRRSQKLCPNCADCDYVTNAILDYTSGPLTDRPQSGAGNERTRVALVQGCHHCYSSCAAPNIVITSQMN